MPSAGDVYKRQAVLSYAKEYKDAAKRLGRGIVFHIAPSNVPVNFAFSLAAGLLAGNKNIVRIPSKDFPQVRIICTEINNLLSEYPDTVSYTHLDVYKRQVICKAFERLPDADIIAFSIENKITKLPDRIQKIGKWKSLRIDSRQIAFRRESILKSGVRFDPLMGAGSGNGAGEENLFLINCLKSGLTIYYVPETVAKLRESESTWFSGYNEMFFYQRGGATRYMLGFGMAFLYGIYYVFCKRALYLSLIHI